MADMSDVLSELTATDVLAAVISGTVLLLVAGLVGIVLACRR